jgi:predicted CoA-binding protein
MNTSTTDQTDAQLREILENAQVIAVVGWSDKEDRPSHETANYLRKQGYRVIPVNPRLAGKTWNGEPIYGCVTDVPEKIDIVDVFRRADMTPHHAAKAVEAGAGTFWLQLGIRNDEAGRIATEGGLNFVEDRCTHLEHLRLIKGYAFPTPP